MCATGWLPEPGRSVAVVPPDWEITDPAAPRCRAEVVDVVDDLVTVRVLGHLRLRRLRQVAPWTDEDDRAVRGGC
ncbi:hypothetical protein OG689_27060 [Kitasatospora sp. NBC_00240]|uniref:hypothetical protein n=1 Tax=Kitasatospora sp. NBC_00240 TaxID=2903567 RepID=UPI00225AB65E|nr:hypothetical protein [Kitasatospora sp. NBC_00240]MCX5212890.1 hypothetical protein [Kitasatospora sp. NBC_00240]